VPNDEHETPEWVLEHVRAVDVIAHDPATNDGNPTGAATYTTATDEPCGLFSDWPRDGLIFVNPPYSRGETDRWASKIVAEHEQGSEVIALVRCDPSTAWARQLINASTLVCYPPRVRFRGATGSPNFSNAIHYLGPRPETFKRAFATVGPIVKPIKSTEGNSNHV